MKRAPGGDTSVSKRAPAKRVSRASVHRGRRGDESGRATVVRRGGKVGKYIPSADGNRSRLAKSNLKGHLLLRAPSMLWRLDAARRRIAKVKKYLFPHQIWRPPFSGEDEEPMWAALEGARKTRTRRTGKFQVTFVEGSSRFCVLLLCARARTAPNTADEETP